MIYHIGPSIFLYNLKLSISYSTDYDLVTESSKGNLGLVKALVPYPAELYSTGDYAINEASINGHLETVKYLISVGCSPSNTGNYSIIWASSLGKMHIVKYLISLNNYEIDPTDNNEKAIGYASENGHLDVVRYLYLLGCDPTIFDYGLFNRPFLDRVFERNKPNVAKYLVSIGCKTNFNLAKLFNVESEEQVKKICNNFSKILAIKDYLKRL